MTDDNPGAEQAPQDPQGAAVAAAPARVDKRAQAFDSSDLGGELVFVPEWDVDGNPWTAWCRGLTALERNEALQAAVASAREAGRTADTDSDSNVFYAHVVVTCALYSEDDPTPIFAVDDVPMLLAKAAKAVDRLAQAVLRISGMTKDDVAKAVEEAGKASSSTPSDAPST